MTLAQYKRIIKSLTRSELEAHLFELFKSSGEFRDLENGCWSKESDDDLMKDLRKRLKTIFWQDDFSLSECKRVLSGFLSRTEDEKTKALMHLAYAFEITETGASYGDMGESFYDSLLFSAQKCLDYAKEHPDFFRAHAEEFENLIGATDRLGYGVSDILSDMVTDVEIYLGYDDDEEEDE